MGDLATGSEVSVTVRTQVFAQVGGEQEGLSTHVAGVGPHSGVDALMLAQAGLVEKGLAAALADVWPRLWVHLLVLLQVGELHKLGLACAARVRAQGQRQYGGGRGWRRSCYVVTLVRLHLFPRAKGEITDGTGELGERGTRGEGLCRLDRGRTCPCNHRRSLLGLFGRVRPLVLTQTGRDHKRLEALVALEGPLASVHAPVFVEAGALGERLAALGACEGPQARVHQHMPTQVPGRHESLITVLALVGPLARVDPLVHGQVRWLPKPLGTFVADIRLEALVGPLVTPKTRGV